MIVVEIEPDFDDWRAHARLLLAERVPPDRVLFRDRSEGATLFGNDQAAAPEPLTNLRLPKQFLDRARRVACHTDEARWDLLYRLAWRLAVERDRGLLDDAADADVRRFDVLDKQVRFDAHKAKAFVRFRKVEPRGDDAPGPAERFVAYHRAEHRVLALVAPFFARRFGVMRWTIFTPHESADWDGATLRLGPGVDADPHEARDHLESLWLTYYASIFNPARIKPAAMLKEMPRRYWSTMPETSLIDELLRDAPQRVKDMMARQKQANPGAEAFLPPTNHRSLPQLASAARQCEGCELHRDATQVVFGQGPATASIMLVGEQPGDKEDLAGDPFVGPAGRLLDDALAAAGIDRDAVYVTNAVKHFRHELRGKARLHKKPTVEHVRACFPWLRAEIEQIRPRIVVALGATAGQALLGPTFRVTRQRGEVIPAEHLGVAVLGTIHPSAILRMRTDAERDDALAAFVADLRTARDAAA